MSDKMLWWLVAILVIFKTILVGWWPFLAHMNVPRDATLILEQAMSLLDGDWLGPYTELTMTRGPVTSMWIASMHFIGVPLLLSQHALYVGACIIAMLALGRLTDSKGFQLCVFSVLLLNPYSYSYELVASAFRETLHQSLTLAIIGLSTLVFVDLAKGCIVRKGHCILLGVLVLLLWHNGDAPVWITTYPGWLMLVLLVHLWWNNRFGDFDTVAGLLSVVLIPVAVWAAGTLTIAWKNHHEYGVFAVVELNTPQFQSAVGGLMAIEAGQREPEATVSPEIFEQVISFPPAFAEVFRRVMEVSPPNSVVDSFSTGSPVFILGVSRLVNSPIRTDEHLGYFLPDFFKRTVKNKTRYLNKLVAAYQTIAPILFWIAVLGLISRCCFMRRSRGWTLLDNVYFGLAGTVLVQLVMLAVLRITGGSTSPSPYAMFYPFFYMFILAGLLSVTRDIHEILPARNSGP